MFLSEPTHIDFIAHHEIQFQSCRGVFEVLSDFHKCNALIGQGAEPSGANVAVLVDHCIFQPKITKDHYRYLLHISHDLADVDVYHDERQFLKNFDLILCPGAVHCQKAKLNLRGVPVIEIGWPKLENINEKARNNVRFKSDSVTIIYAPTFINNREWVDLLPSLISTGYEILIKNNIYYDFESGAAPPRGSELEYQKAIEELLDMEAFLNSSNYKNVKYIDRRTNLCELFPEAQVLISDSSSANLEFISYGLSIETGRFGLDEKETKPYNSLRTARVKYIPLRDLLLLVKDKGRLHEMIGTENDASRSEGNSFISTPPNGPARFGASIIDMFLYLQDKNLQIMPKSNNLVNLILSRLCKSF